MKILLTLIFTVLLTSCSNYVSKIHRELDKEQGNRYRRPKKRDTFAQFRRRQNPSRFSTRTKSNLIPQTKRRYKPAPSRKRYTADDLADNTNEGSLWAGSGNDNYLFTKNKWKRNGDIVLVNVQKNLKDNIASELKRSFPAMPKKKKKKDDKEGAKEKAPPAVAAAPKDETGGDPNKIHDKISSVIIEEISKDHLLVRGQKYLLFRNRKHLIELQALVARRDILDDDTINSSQFLESSITVLR